MCVRTCACVCMCVCECVCVCSWFLVVNLGLSGSSLGLKRVGKTRVWGANLPESGINLQPGVQFDPFPPNSRFPVPGSLPPNSRLTIPGFLPPNSRLTVPGFLPPNSRFPIPGSHSAIGSRFPVPNVPTKWKRSCRVTVLSCSGRRQHRK
jgi:hypothetical protein